MASIGEVQKLSKFFRTPAQARTGLNLQMNGIWGVLSVETHESLFEAQDRRFPPSGNTLQGNDGEPLIIRVDRRG